jgi:hypothetical protein
MGNNTAVLGIQIKVGEAPQLQFLEEQAMKGEEKVCVKDKKKSRVWK